MDYIPQSLLQSALCFPPPRCCRLPVYGENARSLSENKVFSSYDFIFLRSLYHKIPKFAMPEIVLFYFSIVSDKLLFLFLQKPC